MKQFLVCILIVLLPAFAISQYVPVPVTGFNHDVIAEGTGSSSLTTTTREMDAITPSNFVMCTQQFAAANGLPSIYGLPNNGTIVSGTKTYQLAPLGNGTGTTNNAIYLFQNETGLLTLTTPAKFTNLSLLVTATEGNSTVNVTVNYSDGTTQLFGGQVIVDWVNGASPVLQGFGRIKRINGPFGTGTYEQAPTNPRLYALDLAVSCSKTVNSIRITNVSASTSTRAFVFAVSGQSLASPTITPTITNATCGQSNGKIALTVAGGFYLYSWNTTPVQLTATASNLPAGTYTCTITNTSGCTFTYTGTVGTTSSLTLNATAQPAAICTGGSSTLMATATGGSPTTYNWQPGGSGTNSLVVSPTDTTTYKVWATDANGCTDTAYVTLPVNPVPTATFTASPQSVCSGKDTVLFTYTGNAGATANYTWDFGSGTIISGSGAGPYKVVFNTAGNINSTLTVAQNGCTSNTGQQPIQVNASVVAAFSLSADSICAGKTVNVNFTGTTAPSAVFNWNFGNGTVQSGSGAGPYTVQYVPSGNSTIKLLLSNNGCSDSASLPVVVNAIPNANFTLALASICAGDSVTLTYIGNASPGATYTWNFAPGILSSGSNGGPLKVQYLTPGLYPVTLSVNDKGCLSNTGQLSVRVNAIPASTFSLSKDTVCAGQTVTVNFTGSAPAGSTYNWNFGSGTVQSGSGAGPYTILYNNSGNSTVKLVLANGLCKDSSTLPIVVNAVPTSTFTVTPASICSGDSVTATYTGNAGSTATYAWSFSPGTVLSGTNAGPYKIGYNTPGSHNIILTVTDKGCASAATQQPVTVSPPVVASFTLSADTVCAGNLVTVTFNGVATASTTYNWNFGNGTVQQGTGAGPYKILFPDNSNAVVTLSLTNLTCSSGPVSKTVFIRSKPQPAFTASPLTGCAPMVVSFTNTVETGVNYLWQFGDGGTSISPSPSHSYAAGNYTVKLYASAGTCIDSIVKTNYINVLAKPVANFTSSPTTAFAVPLSTAIFGFNNLSQNASSYVWHFGDGDSSIVTQPTHQYLIAGSFPVTLYASNSAGCVDSFTVQYYKIIPDSIIKIPNAFSPNKDGINDTWVIPGMSGYPNAKVQIFNRWGQLVFTSNGVYKPWDGTVNGGPVQTATYYYVIQLKPEAKPVAGWLMLMR